MNQGDTNYLLIVVVIVAASFFLRERGNESELKQLQSQLNTCQVNFEGFKDGVVYGR